MNLSLCSNFTPSSSNDKIYKTVEDVQSYKTHKYSTTDYFDDAFADLQQVVSYRSSRGAPPEFIDDSNNIRDSANTRPICKQTAKPFHTWSNYNPCQKDIDSEISYKGVSDSVRNSCRYIDPESYKRTFSIYDYLPCGTPKMVIEESNNERLGLDTRHNKFYNQ